MATRQGEEILCTPFSPRTLSSVVLLDLSEEPVYLLTSDELQVNEPEEPTVLFQPERPEFAASGHVWLTAEYTLAFPLDFAPLAVLLEIGVGHELEPLPEALV